MPTTGLAIVLAIVLAIALAIELPHLVHFFQSRLTLARRLTLAKQQP